MSGFICQNKACGKAFESKQPRQYCSMKCRANTPEFKKVCAKNLEGKRGHGPARTLPDVPCISCGSLMHMKPIDVKRGKKTCSRLCYRRYMAERFDRWVANPETIEGLQGYDEFLSREELTCPVEGCEWQGANLGLHVNLAHGIKVLKFKKLAGFNLGTGLLAPTARRNFVSRGNRGYSSTLNQPKAVASRRFDYQSRESHEHKQKAALIRQAIRKHAEV